MESRFTLRLGAIAGWIAFAGVVGGLTIVPMILAGQPPTIRTPLADVARYFGHSELITLYAVVGVAVAAVPIVPFGMGLREMTGGSSPRAAAVAGMGFFLLVASIPLYVVSSALGAALASLAGVDASIFGPLHQVYELLYNGAADVLEGAWIGGFSVAMLLGTGPRWIGWLGVTLALSRFVKAFIPVTSLVPDAVSALSGLLFLAWFLAMVVALTRRSLGSVERLVAAGVPA